MLISQALRSLSLTGWPRLGDSARAAPASSSTAARTSLCVHMFHLSGGFDRPGGRPVVMLAGKARDVGNTLGLAALGYDLRACRLHVAGLVPGAALQHRRSPVPAPRHTEARERLALHRLLQGGLRPALAAVRRHHHL